MSATQDLQLQKSPARTVTPAMPAMARSQDIPAARSSATAKLAIRNLCKVFSNRPGPALELLRAGCGKDEILRRTGLVVGVQNASFEIHEGEIFVIMGLSGSGKSTLIRLFNRLIDASSGEIVLDSRDLLQMNQQDLREVRRRDMSMVFQSFALMPHLTAIDNAAFGLELAGIKKRERREAAMLSLDQVGLAAFAHRYPREMSGGQQQRIGLARALAKDPSVMLMDEAFSALDPLIRTEMQDELLRLQREKKRTIVFISHDLDEAMRIGDRIAVMEGGRIVQVGTPLNILRAPADDYVRAFFRNVDVSRVLTAADVAQIDAASTIVHAPEQLHPAREQLIQHDRLHGYVCDTDSRYRGMVSRESLERALGLTVPRMDHAFLEGVVTVPATTSLHDLLGIVARSACPVPVIDDDGMYLGTISQSVLLRTLDRGG